MSFDEPDDFASLYRHARPRTSPPWACDRLQEGLQEPRMNPVINRVLAPPGDLGDLADLVPLFWFH